MGKWKLTSLMTMKNLIVFHEEMMGDIMYYHQTTRQPDTQEFVKAIMKEIVGASEERHRPTVDTDILPSIWAMFQKRNLMSKKGKGHNARLIIHGGKQVYGSNYFKTYALVVTWFAIPCMTILAIFLAWAMQQISLAQTYAQASIECDISMELPSGIET